MKQQVAQRILEENRASYDRMAEEFSDTRTQFWGELAFLAEHALPGMRVLDIGCGNGRFFPLLRVRQVTYTGVDNSKGLLDAARKKYPDTQFVEGDATALPFPDSSFDIAFSFATIHHIPGRALQAAFVREAARVLKPGSTFILTSWDLHTPHWRWNLLRSTFRNLIPFSPHDRGDVFLTFGKTKQPRYVHAFTLPALERLLTENGFTIVGSEIVGRAVAPGKHVRKKTEQNLLVIARKK